MYSLRSVLNTDPISAAIAAFASGGGVPPRSTPAIAMSPPVARACIIFSAVEYM